MADTYQAVYDAVRSRIGYADVGAAVESAAREAFSNTDTRMASIAQDFAVSAYEQQRPSVLMRPSLSIDGAHWCALYGADLQSGVAGFGDTPALAMNDFDLQWNTQRAAAQKGTP